MRKHLLKLLLFAVIAVVLLTAAAAAQASNAEAARTKALAAADATVARKVAEAAAAQARADSAKLTLLTGTEKQEVELKPAGDKLEATGSFKVGPCTKAVAVVIMSGKPAGTVRFTIK